MSEENRSFMESVDPGPVTVKAYTTAGAATIDLVARTEERINGVNIEAWIEPEDLRAIGFMFLRAHRAHRRLKGEAEEEES